MRAALPRITSVFAAQDGCAVMTTADRSGGKGDSSCLMNREGCAALSSHSIMPGGGQIMRGKRDLIAWKYMEKGEINQRLSRVAQLMNSPVKIAVSYDAFLAEGIFSCALLADGAVLNRGSRYLQAISF